MLSFAKDKEKAKHFMDFLASPESREIYKEFGWCVPGE
jgi:ABC-type molybdate transport system substrate-binding protein